VFQSRRDPLTRVSIRVNWQEPLPKVDRSSQRDCQLKQKRVAAAEEYTRKRLLLMDTDKNGKVPKQEFMSFMEAEFDRLDTKHDGELDVKELAKLRLRPYVGK